MTDGVNDSTIGSQNDFETFFFGPQFSGLDRVEVLPTGWSLDNVVVNVPEANSTALLGAFLAVAVLLKVRK